MAPLKIRKADMRDAIPVAGFCRKMARESEGRDLDPDTVLRGVKAVMKDPHKGFYLVAEKDGAMIGQLLVTKEWSDWNNGYYWWIQSVYVPPEQRAQGVFTRLYRFLRESAGFERGVAGLRLYVMGDNDTAKAAYESLGMVRTEYQIYEAAPRPEADPEF